MSRCRNFSRPFSRTIILGARYPSDESLGYYQPSVSRTTPMVSRWRYDNEYYPSDVNFGGGRNCVRDNSLGADSCRRAEPERGEGAPRHILENGQNPGQRPNETGPPCWIEK